MIDDIVYATLLSRKGSLFLAASIPAGQRTAQRISPTSMDHAEPGSAAPDGAYLGRAGVLPAKHVARLARHGGFRASRGTAIVLFASRAVARLARQDDAVALRLRWTQDGCAAVPRAVVLPVHTGHVAHARCADVKEAVRRLERLLVAAVRRRLPRVICAELTQSGWAVCPAAAAAVLGDLSAVFGLARVRSAKIPKQWVLHLVLATFPLAE